jgi:hypothetical protein
MLYIAHCSFDETGNERRYGYFNFLVEAPSVEEAGERLRKEIIRARKRSDLFDDAVKIYVDHIVEIASLPKRGLLVRYQSFEGEAPPVLFCPVPPGSSRGCKVYGVGPEGGDDEDAESLEPFVEFEARRA